MRAHQTGSSAARGFCIYSCHVADIWHSFDQLCMVSWLILNGGLEKNKLCEQMDLTKSDLPGCDLPESNLPKIDLLENDIPGSYLP